jgi:predicted lactoylglutathione lyase
MCAQPVFDSVNLVVGDMEASVAFYRQIGLTINDPDATWQPHHRTAPMPDGIDFDLDSISFAQKWDHGVRADRPSVVLGFRVASREAVDEIYAHLTAAGYEGQQPPYDAFWGARYCVVGDPDGNGVAFASPVDNEFRSAPPTP